jgi:hypothetical protein
MRIIGADRATQSAERSTVRSETSSGREAWTLIGWIGLIFVLMGVVDIALGVYPTAFGNAEWEFGVASGILNGFAIPTMGAYLLLSSAVARQKAALSRTIAVLMWVIAAVLVILGLLYVTVVPAALKSVDRSDVILLGMKKAIVKAVLFLVAYWFLYAVGGLKGWKAAKRS